MRGAPDRVRGKEIFSLICYPFIPDVKYGISQAQLSTFSLLREKGTDVKLECCLKPAPLERGASIG